MTDDELLDALAARAGGRSGKRPCVGHQEIRAAEAALGTSLPALVRRVYVEVSDGGPGRGHGLLPLHGDGGLVETYREFRRHSWPAGLLPCWDWGDAIWSCVDPARDGGAIVTHDNERRPTLTTFTVSSWLDAWLKGEPLWSRLFRDEVRTISSPFTHKPIETRVGGEPIGVPWRPVA